MGLGIKNVVNIWMKRRKKKSNKKFKKRTHILKIDAITVADL